MLEGTLAVRKTQSRRFLASVVWKPRYCVLRKDSMSTLSIYKDFKDGGGVPSDILNIDGSTRVIKDANKEKPIVHLVTENGGISTTKVFAFESVQEQSIWEEAIERIVKQGNRERKEVAAASPVVSKTVNDVTSEREDTTNLQPVVEEQDSKLSTIEALLRDLSATDTGPLPTNSTVINSSTEPVIKESDESESFASPVVSVITSGNNKPGNKFVSDPDLPSESSDVLSHEVSLAKTIRSHNIQQGDSGGKSSALETDKLRVGELDIGASIGSFSDAPSSVIRRPLGTNTPILSVKPPRPQHNVSQPSESTEIMDRPVIADSTCSNEDRIQTSTFSPVSESNDIALPSLSRPPELSRSTSQRGSKLQSKSTTTLTADNPLQWSSGGITDGTPPRRSDRNLTSGLGIELGVVVTEKVSHVDVIGNPIPLRREKLSAVIPPVGRITESDMLHDRPFKLSMDSSNVNKPFPSQQTLKDDEIKCISDINRQLNEELATHKNCCSECETLRAQITLLSSSVDDWRMRYSAMEEQSRVFSQECTNLSKKLETSEEELLREKKIISSMLRESGKDHVSGLVNSSADETNLNLVAISATESVQYRNRGRADDDDVWTLRIEALENKLQSKELEVSRYMRLNQELKLDVEELKKINRTSASANFGLEQRFSEELEQEMSKETIRMNFLEQENVVLKETIVLREGELEKLSEQINGCKNNEALCSIDASTGVDMPDDYDFLSDRVKSFQEALKLSQAEVNALESDLANTKLLLKDANKTIFETKETLCLVQDKLNAEENIKDRLQDEVITLRVQDKNSEHVGSAENDKENYYRTQSEDLKKQVYRNARCKINTVIIKSLGFTCSLRPLWSSLKNPSVSPTFYAHGLKLWITVIQSCSPYLSRKKMLRLGMC